MSHDRAFYKAGPETAAKVAQFFDEARVAHKAADVFAAEFGAECCVASGSLIVGLQMPADAKTPHGFRRNPGGDCVPNKRTKDGRDIAKRIRDLPRLPDLSTIVLGFRIANSDRGGHRIVQCGARTFKDGAAYIEMHEGDEPPADCVKVKRSEYYALVEAEDAERAA
jgi:hypothetical protein